MPEAPGTPLIGRTVVVTRAVAQAAELADRLTAAGAQVLEFPTIEIADPESWEPADEAIARLETYDWIVLTSANAVDHFMDRVRAAGVDERVVADARVVAVGPATASRCIARGIRPCLVPDEHRAEGVLEGLVERGVGPGSRVLVPRALEAREVLPDTLRGRGATVDVVPVYRTVCGVGRPGVIDRMSAGTVDAITFTSSSTARNFAQLTGDLDLPTLMRGVVVASIGPVTSDTLRGLGLDVAVEPAESTVPELVRALGDHFSPPPETGMAAGSG